MKVNLTIIMILLTQGVFGQLGIGTYRISSDTFHVLTGRNFSELVMDHNKTFTYKYLTSVSCLLWYDSYGTWQTKNDHLILVDTVTSFHPVIDFVKYMHTDNNKISITVRSKDSKPLEGVKIKHLFKNDLDTLIGTTNANGNLIIDTKDKKRKEEDNGKIRVVDDVEIWIVHVNSKGQQWTTNNVCTLSSVIDCVINDNAVDKEIQRTTTYKIDNDNLIFQSQTFSEQDAQPGYYLYGNFRLVKE